MSALVKSFKTHFGDKKIQNGLDVFKYFDAKNPSAIILIDQFYETLSIGIANLIYALNPAYVVIGGGITARPTFINELTVYIEKRLSPYMRQSTKIVSASYKNDAGIMCAYLNFRQKNTLEKMSLNLVYSVSTGT